MSLKTSEERRAYFDAVYAAMPREVLIPAVEYLRTRNGEWPIDRFKALYEKYGSHEWFMHLHDDLNEKIKNDAGGNPIFVAAHPHMGWGMGLRNALRTGAGLPDNLLPLGNWDDYYVSVLEATLGFREIPPDPDAFAVAA